MKKKKRNTCYIVWHGRKTGIFHSWKECSEQVDKFPGARYKGFTKWEEAERVWGEGFEKYESDRTSRDKEPSHYRPKPKVDPIIRARAKMLHENFAGGKTGSHTVTCSAVNCTYPKCLCK